MDLGNGVLSFRTEEFKDVEKGNQRRIVTPSKRDFKSL